MKRTSVFIILTSVLISCAGKDTEDHQNRTSTSSESISEESEATENTIEEEPSQETPPIMESATSEQEVSTETFQNEDESWGYKILLDGSVYVNQPHIPAVQGKKGFANELDAEKAATLVADKVRNGISPPTVSKEELKELGVID